MVVAANGNVGIGSVNPLGRVDVVASAGTNSNVYVRRSASTDQALFVSYPSGALSASNPGWYSGLYGSSSDWYLSTWDGTNTITRIEVTPVGHVGIGKVPGTNLDVSGTMSLSSASANSSLFTAYTGANGRSYAISSCKGCSTVGVGGFEIYDATAAAGRAFIAAGVNGWQTPSDRRLKKDIQTLSVLDKLGPVRGVSYKLKDSGKPQIGVIAQEVNQSFPLAVTGKDDGSKFLSVSYDAIALEGVKQLKFLFDTDRAETSAKLKAANDNIADLRNQLKALRDEVAEMKNARR